MYAFAADPALPKPELYRELLAAADALTADEPDPVANMANLAALIAQLVPELNWAGFYRLIPATSPATPTAAPSWSCRCCAAARSSR